MILDRLQTCPTDGKKKAGHRPDVDAPRPIAPNKVFSSAYGKMKTPPVMTPASINPPRMLIGIGGISHGAQSPSR